MRHPVPGSCIQLQNYVDSVIINAGDGSHCHPTQAMLDVFTLRRHFPDLRKIIITIVGDIMHSRVARSQIHAFKILGFKEVRVVAPKTLIPADIEQLGVEVFNDIDKGLRGAHAVAMLRLQRERMTGAYIPNEKEYYKLYGLTPKRVELLDDNGIVLHPGPVNRGVEISSEVADGPRSVILQQVTYGIAVRMAIMSMAMQH